MTDLREEIEAHVTVAACTGWCDSRMREDRLVIREATDAILAAIDQHLTPYPALSKAWLHAMVDMIVSEERGTPGLTADEAKAEIDAAIAALPAPVSEARVRADERERLARLADEKAAAAVRGARSDSDDSGMHGEDYVMFSGAALWLRAQEGGQ